MVRGHADPVYPPSLYKAISYASTLGVPVYILENGMPSKEDDSRRSDWINGCLAEVQLCNRAVRSRVYGLVLIQPVSAPLLGGMCARCHCLRSTC